MRDELELLTVTQAAELADRSTTTVYKWLDSGKVRGYRLGKWRLLDKAGFVEFLAAYEPAIGRPKGA